MAPSPGSRPRRAAIACIAGSMRSTKSKTCRRYRSDFLRVEFKTDLVAPPSLRGVFLSPAPPDKASEMVEFEKRATARVATRRTARTVRRRRPERAPEPDPVTVDGRGRRGNVLDKRQSHTVSQPARAAVEALRFLLRTELPSH